MKNGIVSGFRQATGLWLYAVPLLTAALILLNYIDPLIRAYQENSFIIRGYHIELLLESYHSDALSSFIPILAALPFSGSFVDDVKSKFTRFFVIRSNYRTYLASRILVAFLVGGMVILSGALVAWGITAAALIPLEQDIEGLEPTTANVLIDVCFLLFLTGGFWSVVGLSMSTLMESKYIAYASSFVLYYVLVILYERYLTEFYVIYPHSWINPTVWPYGCWGSTIFLLEMTTIFSLLFAFRGLRRLKEL